jgi:hypothetical protein
MTVRSLHAGTDSRGGSTRRANALAAWRAGTGSKAQCTAF